MEENTEFTIATTKKQANKQNKKQEERKNNWE